MSSESETEYIGSPEDAFSVLGDETRLGILLELAQGLADDDEGIGFSELRKRVGIEDSGRFNYHLDKLSDGFIKKQDGKYAVRPAGLAVVSAVYSGTYGEDVGEHTAESSFGCPDCGEPLTIVYRSDHLLLNCEEHDTQLGYPTPPGAYRGRSLAELAAVVIKRTLTGMNLARQGICPRCWGETTVQYPVDSEHETERSVTWTRLSCGRCWYGLEPPLRTLFGCTSAVRAFYVEHGHEVGELFFGQQSIADPDTCQVICDETESVTATATITLGEDTLVVELDENCQVTEQYRE